MYYYPETISKLKPGSNGIKRTYGLDLETPLKERDLTQSYDESNRK